MRSLVPEEVLLGNQDPRATDPSHKLVHREVHRVLMGQRGPVAMATDKTEVAMATPYLSDIGFMSIST